MNKNLKYLVQASMTACLYTVLVLAFRPISFGSMQVRIAEALTILPFFIPSAIPGLTIGCLLSGILGGADILDVVFGTLATFIGAVGSYLLRKHRFLVPLPPIAANTIIVPWVLRFAYGEAQPIWLLMLSVGAGEVIACGILGMLLLFTLNKYKHYIFT